MNIRTSILLRVRIAFLFVLLVAVMIIIKIIRVQYFSDTDWAAKYEESHVKMRTIKATRGNIYADDGSLLATSLPFYRLAIDPSLHKMDRHRRKIFNEGIDSLCYLLADYYGDRTAQGYKRYILDASKSNRQYLILNARLIDYHTKKKMSEWPIFREGQMMGGVIFEKVEKRFIPFAQLARRTIGYVKEEKRDDGNVYHFGAGIEHSYDSLLSGKNGKALFARISGGGWKPMHTEEEVKPRHGYDIESTIDINIQDVTETALLKALRLHEADNGCAVVMEVKTGDIKAIANLDKITKESGEFYYQELYNYAVGKRTEPGSTMKLATMMALFEEDKSLSLADSLDTYDGTYAFYDRKMTDSHLGGYGKITVKEAFEKSSNVGVAQLAFQTFGKDKVGQQKFVNYLKDFGFDQKIDIDLDGAAAPKLKSPSDKSWSGVTIPWMSIGYEVEMSPLHLLTFYNAVANNGKMMAPKIVKSIRFANREISTMKDKVLSKKICSNATLKKSHTILESVVESGTAQNINNENYKIAGKTGTTQKLVNGKYVAEYYVSFVGYFPANLPKYSIIVTVDNPTKGKIYGSQVAAPVFKEIADKIYARDLDIHRPAPKEKKTEKGVFPVVQSGYYHDMKKVCNVLNVNVLPVNNEGVEWRTATRDEQTDAIRWKDMDVQPGVIPDVRGMTLRDAMALLENHGLHVDFKGMGRVKKQSVLPGKKVIVGDRIVLELG